MRRGGCGRKKIIGAVSYEKSTEEFPPLEQVFGDFISFGSRAKKLSVISYLPKKV